MNVESKPEATLSYTRLSAIQAPKSQIQGSGFCKKVLSVTLLLKLELHPPWQREGCPPVNTIRRVLGNGTPSRIAFPNPGNRAKNFAVRLLLGFEKSSLGKKPTSPA